MCIEFKNIELLRLDKIILTDVNTVFSKGLNLIYGSSGSGKTSLLKLINLLISPNRGSIFYKKKDIQSFDTARWRSNCILTNQTTIFAEGSVMENILLPFSFKVHKSKTTDNNLLESLLYRFNLTKDILDKNIKKLSGGEAQRIALIRSILLKPEIFLFDEPTSALDYSTQENVFSYLKELSKKHICIVASHSKDAKKYADSIFTIEKGKLKNV